MTIDIVGREEELASLRAFLDAPPEGAMTLRLEGDAGIGKSTLWGAGVELARERGLRVLRAHPAQAERSLAYAGLGDLFEGVLDETLPLLSAPRRRALEIVMLRAEAADGVDQRAVGVAVRDVLQHLSERERILIAVDDVQWLDPPSSTVFDFALRRLAAHDVRLLLARRLDGGESSVRELLLDGEVGHRLALAPLDAEAVHQLLRDRLGRAFPRQTLLRIHERSGGNPFYAMELARVLKGDLDPLEPLRVPETLEELLRARLADLPAVTREALELTALLGTPSLQLLERAEIAADAVDPAMAEHVVEIEDGVVRFTHPMLASVLDHDLGERRRGVHARIAGIVDDPLQRARHLALATAGPDERVASVVEEAAMLAGSLGTTETELAELAVRLTPPEALEDRRRRSLAAARSHLAAGEWTRARTIATELLDQGASGSGRAEVLILLSELETVDRAAELLGEALRVPATRPELLSLIHCRLAWVTRFTTGHHHAEQALRLAEQVDDDVLRARAQALRAVLGWFRGDVQFSAELLASADDLPAALGGERLIQEATLAIVNTYAPAATRDQARAWLEVEYLAWRERDEPRGARARWGLAWIEFWAGRWDVATAHAESAHNIAIQYGIEVPQDLLPLAVIAVHAGSLELAREYSERALRLADEQFGFDPPQHLAVLGHVAMRSGDSSAALERFRSADRRAAALGWREPSLRWWTADHAELLLELGRIDDAEALLEAWQADAIRVGRVWVLAGVSRGRGLVAAARGQVDRAQVLLEEAVTQHEAVGDPFGRARAQLALGIVMRRARQKRRARAAIEAAAEGFDAVGARGWAAEARSELGRIGGRREAQGLTPAENRVAELVAQGRTNKEVAAALLLGERTVATHLTHIYRKLGVRSRTELAHRVSHEPDPEPPKPQRF